MLVEIQAAEIVKYFHHCLASCEVLLKLNLHFTGRKIIDFQKHSISGTHGFNRLFLNNYTMTL